jgi:chromosome partitioning protein
MRTIAILNQKGGVGKTTTAVNLSAALAQAGQRVLLLDLDPQSHATLHLGAELAPEDTSIYEVLTRGAALADASRTIGAQLVLVPATVDLVGAELELADVADRERVLTRALTPYAPGFDVCVIDCAPSLGLLTVNALAAAGEVMIPLQPHFLALQGLGRLLETVTLVRQALNPRLQVAGVVLCMYEKGTRLAQEVHDDVAGFLAAAEPGAAWHGACVFETVIRRNIKLAESPSFGQTVFDYAPGSHGAEDYAALAQEVLTRHVEHAEARPPAVTEPAAALSAVDEAAV